MKPILIDTDPGIDDAMAILLALVSPEVRVEAITAVAGNVPVETGARNALRLLALAGVTGVRVAAGAHQPLRRPLHTAEHVHGPGGIGGAHLPEPAGLPETRHAAEVMRRAILAHPGEMTLVALGPLTNVATVLADEQVRAALKEIIVMGGSAGSGNVTPVAEFNFHCDAEAARAVFESGVAIRLLTLETTGQVRLARKHLERLHQSPSPLARAVAEMGEHYLGFAERAGHPGAALHDPLAVALAVDPAIARESSLVRVDIETKGEYTYGQSVISARKGTATPNAELVVGIDVRRFFTLFLERLLET